MTCDHWNIFRTTPEIAQLAEEWATKPGCEWTDTDEKLYDWLYKKPDHALSVICAIAQVTDSPDTLNNLAAGPLEDFLGIHGEQYFDIIRALSRDHPRFQEVLCGVWKGSMSKVLWQRIRAVSVGRLR